MRGIGRDQRGGVVTVLQPRCLVVRSQVTAIGETFDLDAHRLDSRSGIENVGFAGGDKEENGFGVKDLKTFI